MEFPWHRASKSRKRTYLALWHARRYAVKSVLFRWNGLPPVEVWVLVEGEQENTVHA
jgi:hypothetical protein